MHRLKHKLQWMMLALAAFAATGNSVAAQEPAEPLNAEARTAAVETYHPIAPSPLSVTPCGNCPEPGRNYYDPSWEPDSDCLWLFQCVDWYVKAGPVFPLSSGFFEDRIKTGWTVQLNARQTVECPWLPLDLFAELGGGYAGNNGQEADAIDPEDFLTPDLQRLHRGWGHTAVGGYFRPASLNVLGHQLHIGFRGGIRVGHVHAEYETTVLPIGNVNQTDIFWGLFGSIGLGVTYHDVCCGFLPRMDLTMGAEVEFAHDWISLGTFGENDEGLATAAPMFTLAVRF